MNTMILQRSQTNLSENEIAKMVIQAAIRVHRNTCPGLLESAYKTCLQYELIQNGLNVETEKPMPLFYEEIKMDCEYRLDILVNNKLVVEVKSVEAINDIHLAQTLTYMKIGNFKLGLLLNFNVLLLKHGIKRLINGTL